MKFLALVTFFLTFLFFPTIALAHPIDQLGDIKTYDQKQTLEVGEKEALLTIDLTFYALDKIKVWESIDTNRDREISINEKRKWMKIGQESSWIETKDQKSSFVAERLTFPNYYNFFSTKPAKVKIEYLAKMKIEIGKNLFYNYEFNDKKLSEIDLTVKGAPGFKVTQVNKISDSQISFIVEKGEGARTILGIQTGTRLNDFLNKYIKTENTSFNLVVFALGGAFIIGVLHALTPGHGKAIVASYLVGERGTIIHAVNLGLIVTITHTASVFILGIASLLLTKFFLASKVIRGLNLISGALVLGFGLTLLFQRTRKLLKSNHHAHEHVHNDIDEKSISWKNLVALGISGGIVPCIDALAILVIAVSLQKIFLGLVLLVSFSLGLASALISAGLVTVLAKEAAKKRYHNLEHYQDFLGAFSAIVITILGLGILIKK